MASGCGNNNKEWNLMHRSGPSGMHSMAFAVQELDRRPDYMDAKTLRSLYPCAICKQVVLHAHQTPCANRVCETCVTKMFGTRDIIKPCPLPHDDMDDDDEEYDCKDGLQRQHVFKDVAAMKDLSRAQVYCENKAYGCPSTMAWKRLKEHLEICPFKPVRCPRKGCDVLFSAEREAEHLAVCLFIKIICEFCGEQVKRGDLEEHLEECEKAQFQSCPICSREFPSMRELANHRRICLSCLRDDCRDCLFCNESFKSNWELRKHLETAFYSHMEIVATKALSADIKVNLNQLAECLGRFDCEKRSRWTTTFHQMFRLRADLCLHYSKFVPYEINFKPVTALKDKTH